MGSRYKKDKTVTVCLSIPSSVREKMKQHKELNFSKIATDAIREQIRQQESFIKMSGADCVP